MQQSHTDCIEKHTCDNCPIKRLVLDHVTNFYTPSLVSTQEILPKTFTIRNERERLNWATKPIGITGLYILAYSTLHLHHAWPKGQKLSSRTSNYELASFSEFSWYYVTGLFRHIHWSSEGLYLDSSSRIDIPRRTWIHFIPRIQNSHLLFLCPVPPSSEHIWRHSHASFVFFIIQT